jgi:hypothetical protein
MLGANGRPMRSRASRPIYRLLAPFRYQSDVAALVEIEPGFITDLFSQPIAAMLLLGAIGQEESLPHYMRTASTSCRALADKMAYEARVLRAYLSRPESLLARLTTACCVARRCMARHAASSRLACVCHASRSASPSLLG